jgi:hypothetical protein
MQNARKRIRARILVEARRPLARESAGLRRGGGRSAVSIATQELFHGASVNKTSEPAVIEWKMGVESHSGIAEPTHDLEPFVRCSANNAHFTGVAEGP